MLIKRNGQAPEKIGAPNQRKHFERAGGRHVDAPKPREGKWLNNDMVAQFPNARREFDLSRSKSARPREFDQNRKDIERKPLPQGEGRGSQMVKQDAPHLRLTPPKELAQGADRESFNARWLSESRDAAFSNINRAKIARSETPSLGRSPTPSFKGPSMG